MLVAATASLADAVADEVADEVADAVADEVADGTPDGVATCRSEPMAVSTAIRDRLCGSARSVEVLAAMSSALYLRCETGELLAVVASDAVLLPFAAVLGVPRCRRPLSLVPVGSPGWIGGGRVQLPGLRAHAVRSWEPRPRLGPIRRDLLRAGVSRLTRLTANTAPGATGLSGDVLRTTTEAIRAALRHEDTARAVASAGGLIGLGPGLTPAGDDLLAGLLTALVVMAHSGGTALGDGICRTATERTTELSRALLEHAALGRCCPQAGRLLRAVVSDGDLAGSYAGIRRVGHTSGAALALGLGLGAAAVLDRADAA